MLVKVVVLLAVVSLWVSYNGRDSDIGGGSGSGSNDRNKIITNLSGRCA